MDLENHFVFIRTVTLYWFSKEISKEISLPWIFHLHWCPDNSQGILLYEFVLFSLSYVKLRQIFFPTEKNAFSFIFTKMNRQLVNKPFAHIRKFLV